MPYNKCKGKGYLWLMAHTNYDSPKCLLWPFATVRGYGQFGFNGEILRAHRFMCALVHGTPAAGDTAYMAAHSCHNPTSCNPRHLSWKTNSENQLGRRENGTAKTAKLGMGGRVLNPHEIEKIKDLRHIGKFTVTQIAQNYGVSRRTIERALTAAKGS